MRFKIILVVVAVFVPMTIFGIAKSYCDWADAQEKRKEAAKWATTQKWSCVSTSSLAVTN